MNSVITRRWGLFLSWFKRMTGSGKEDYWEFNRRCKADEFSNGDATLTITQEMTNNPTKKEFDEFETEFSKLLREGKIDKINFNSNFPSGSYQFSGDGDLEKSSLNELQIASQVPNCELEFKFIRVRLATVSWHGHPDVIEPIVFDNCEFMQLNLMNDSRVCLKDCKVGTLIVNKAHQIHMDGGCVLSIQVVAPGADNPLTGSVNFSNTFFPRNKFKYLLASAQPYRNMRHHLRAIENGHMANVFHSAELAVERADDSLLNKCISYAYELLSDFGSSALRPAVWWVALLFVFMMERYPLLIQVRDGGKG